MTRQRKGLVAFYVFAGVTMFLILARLFVWGAAQYDVQVALERAENVAPAPVRHYCFDPDVIRAKDHEIRQQTMRVLSDWYKADAEIRARRSAIEDDLRMAEIREMRAAGVQVQCVLCENTPETKGWLPR